MQLTHDEAVRRLWQHRLLWFVLVVGTFLMLVFFAAKATVGFIVADPSSPVTFVRIAVALDGMRALPVVSSLWRLAPDVESERVAGFLLSPYVSVMEVLFCCCLMERATIKRLAAAAGHIQIVPDRQRGVGNRIGNVYAYGDLHISQTIHEKPSERLLWRAVVTAMASALAGGIVKFVAAWPGH